MVKFMFRYDSNLDHKFEVKGSKIGFSVIKIDLQITLILGLEVKVKVIFERKIILSLKS